MFAPGRTAVRQRGGHGGETGRDKHRARGSLQLAQRVDQSFDGRSVREAVGIALFGSPLHRFDAWKEHGGSAHDRRIDEAVEIPRPEAGMRQHGIDAPGLRIRPGRVLAAFRHHTSSCIRSPAIPSSSRKAHLTNATI
jgi:hypothetical protein